MVWVVEARPSARHTSLNRRTGLLHLVLAELRRSWLMQAGTLAAGFGVWALVLTVTERTPTNPTPAGSVFNLVSSLLLSMAPVLLALSGGRRRLTERLQLWRSLPLSRSTVARLVGVTTVLPLWPALVTWPVIIQLLAGVYGPQRPWVVAFAAGATIFGALLALRTSLAAFAIFILLPIQMAAAYFVPGAGDAASTWARFLTSPWATLLIFAGIAIFTVHLVRRPPPTMPTTH